MSVTLSQTRYAVRPARLRPSRWVGWVAFGVSLAAYTTLAIVGHQPFHEGARALRFFDLRVYRGGAERILHGRALYRGPILRGLGFTYPPFSALILAPLALASLRADEIVVTTLNALALVWLMRRTLLIPGERAGRGRTMPQGARAWSLAALLAAAALWLEPISVTIGYGQIDLLVALLVVWDLSRPAGAPGRGLAVGLAAAIKLTPLLFLVYLLLSGERRAAARGVAAFAGSVLLAFVVLGGDASAYWAPHGDLSHSSRVGNAADTADQSLNGLLLRAGAHSPLGLGWHLLIVAVTLLGLTLAVRAARRGDAAAGFSLTALSALLASPISWTHHWTLAVPAVVLLARRAERRRSRGLAAATAGLLALGYLYLPERPLHPGLGGRLVGDPYVVAALLALLLTLAQPAVRLIRARRRLT